MKRTFALIGMASAFFVTDTYADLDYGDTGTLKLSQGSQSFGNGGAFEANPTTPTTGSINLGNFQTFCVELNEEFNPGGTYYYQINSGAVADSGDSGSGGSPVYGHVDATDTLAGPGHGLNQDNISIGTAWLYSQFRAGNLTGYLGTSATAGALQDAIWYLEGEITLSQLDPTDTTGTGAYNGASGSLAWQYITEAATHTGTTTTDASGTIFGDSNGKYGVVVVNLFNSSSDSGGTGLVQDQLAIVPEPTTLIAGAMLMLPFGANTLRFVRRNRKA